jgi:Cytochrome c7 and related cytochrome c
MTGHWLDGPAYWLTVGVLSAAVIGMGVVVGATIVLPELSAPVPVAADPSPSPSAAVVAPSASARMVVTLPANADCSACHLTEGQIGLRDIPTMAHPVEGWTDCTACHANDRLVKTAPGHTGIHKDQCLACHKPPSPTASSALPRPHHVVTGTACITCHGSKAPLPTDMAGRTNCWICHPDASSAELFGTPAPTAPGSPVP